VLERTIYTHNYAVNSKKSSTLTSTCFVVVCILNNIVLKQNKLKGNSFIPFCALSEAKGMVINMSVLKIKPSAYCPYCGIKFTKGNRRQITCRKNECIKEHTKKLQMLRYNKLKSEGLCVRCGKIKAENHILCLECNKANIERGKQRIKKLTNEGLCTKCGAREPIKGKKRCTECAKKVNDSRLKCGRKLRAIICSECKQEKLHHAKGLCKSCYDKFKKKASLHSNKPPE
jgi:hypothetical protein